MIESPPATHDGDVRRVRDVPWWPLRRTLRRRRCGAALVAVAACAAVIGSSAIVGLHHLGPRDEPQPRSPGAEAETGNDPQEKPAVVKRWAKKDKAAPFWIFEDLPAGLKRAERSGKPVFVTYRCVP